MAYCVEVGGEDLSCCSDVSWSFWFTKMFVWSLTYQQSVFKQYHSNRDFSAFYLQDDGENGGHGHETKLRHRHAMCKESVYYTGGIGD